MTRLFTNFIAVLAIAVLSACAQLGVPKPNTFEDNVAVALATNAKVRLATDVLFKEGVISHAAATDVQQRADEARMTINLARGLVSVDPSAARTQLAAATAILNALDAELAKKGTTK